MNLSLAVIGGYDDSYDGSSQLMETTYMAQYPLVGPWVFRWMAVGNTGGGYHLVKMGHIIYRVVVNMILPVNIIPRSG